MANKKESRYFFAQDSFGFWYLIPATVKFTATLNGVGFEQWRLIDGPYKYTFSAPKRDR